MGMMLRINNEKNYSRLSLLFGVPGLIIQWSSYGILGVVGVILTIVGLSYYVRTKARHPALSIIWLPSILGAIGTSGFSMFGFAYSLLALLYFSTLKCKPVQVN